MPLVRLKDVRNMSYEKRKEKLNDLRVELSKLRAMVRIGGSLENPSKIKEIKRTIARILTIENEQRRGVENRK